MIVCQRCGKENQDHYKFCLGCGAELSSSDAGEAVGMMKTMMADVGSSPLPGLGNVGQMPPAGPPPGVGAPPQGPAGHQPPPQAPHQHAGPPPGMPPQQPHTPYPAPGQPPQQAQSPYPAPGQPPQGRPVGGQFPPTAPQQPHAPAGPPPGVGAPQGPGPGPAAASGPRKCPSCSADVPPNFKFCGVCGTIVEQAPTAPQSPSPAMQATVPEKTLTATMTLIRPDGSEGGSHNLKEGVNRIGREHGAIFESDGYLSPNHAEIEITQKGHCIRDMGSLNGIFVRMTAEEELKPGQIIRIGQELLKFELVEAPAPKPDGTEVMGSPNPGYWGRITVIIGEEVEGAAFPLLGDSITLGREHGDINFPDDGYVSGMHARLVNRNNQVFLSDMDSSNGTFMKVQGQRELPNNSYVLLGQQLFRITVS